MSGQYQAGGVTADHDEEGYLTDITQWNKDLAEVIAKAENVDMTAEHWEVVRFLRGALGGREMSRSGCCCSC